MLLIVQWLLQTRCAPVASLAHVVDTVGLFLVDGYDLPLDQVVRKDARTVLQFLLTHESFGKHFDDQTIGRALCAAAQRDRLGAMQMLLEYNVSRGFPAQLARLGLFQEAIRSGSLATLRWLWDNRPELCHADPAVTKPAWPTDLAVIQFLHQRDLLAQPQQVANQAAADGHVPVLKFLRSTGMNCCANCLLTRAVMHGQLMVVQWLEDLAPSHPCERIPCCEQHWFGSESLENDGFVEVKQLMAQGSQRGTTCQSLQWITECFPEVQWDHNYLIWASQVGDLYLVAWLYERVKSCCDEWVFGICVECASRAGHADVVRFMLAHGHRLDCLDAAIVNGPQAVATYLSTGCMIDQQNPSIKRHFVSLPRKAYVSAVMEETMRCGHYDIVKLLCETHNSWNKRQMTLLAAKLGAMDLIDLFGIKNQATETRVAALAMAIQGGQRDMVQYLLDECRIQAEVNHSSRFFKDAIESALMCGRVDAVDFCLSRLPITGYNDWFCVILHAVAHKQINVLKGLHQNHANGFDSFTMDSAALRGCLGIVRFLHEHRDEGCSAHAMDAAAAGGFLHVVKYLHEHRCEGCTTQAMDNAAENGHLRVVRFLHENRDEGCTKSAIYRAAKNGHLEMVKFLLTQRREADAQSALEGACEGGHLDIVQWVMVNDREVDCEAVLRSVKRAKQSCRNWKEQRQVVAFMKARMIA